MAEPLKAPTIPADIAEVLAGTRPWAVACLDNLTLASELPDQCVDMVMGSPPYEAQRTYGIGFKLKGQEWVDWMVGQWHQWQRISRGPVVMVVEGFTKDFRYSATPFLLVADLHRAGFNLRKPPVYYRHGIPGSGGKDWFANLYELCVCTTPPGRLAWSDNTACGHKPKWAPGGEMSYRLSNGTRCNQWGGHKRSSQQRRADGTRQPPGRPSHVVVQGADPPSDGLFGESQQTDTPTRPRTDRRLRDRGKANGQDERQQYRPPTLANPGNVIKCKVGGGQMGSRIAHGSEAPYPEDLAERFIRSFCPPGGVVFDPFAGSGTTLAVAIRWRRRAIGTDVRQSQVDLTTSRCLEETPMLDGII